jgi:hypothetical protein
VPKTNDSNFSLNGRLIRALGDKAADALIGALVSALVTYGLDQLTKRRNHESPT